jgi:hypothetical protein
MEKLSYTRNACIRAFSWTARCALLVVVAGTLLGCGKSKSSSPSALGTFCNGLVESGSDFTGYLNFTGDGVDTTWYAISGDCTPCVGMPAGKSLRFEFGDEYDWIYRFTKTLDIDGEYKFKAEIDDDTGYAGITIYVPKSGYTCEDISYI